MHILVIFLIILLLFLIYISVTTKIENFILLDIDEVTKMDKKLVELRFGVVIESEADDIYDNGEDYLEVYYRGSEKYEDL